MKMTLNEAAELLFESGVDNALGDARALFRKFAGARDIDLIDRGFSSDSEELYRAVMKRAAREPLQYLIGEVDFYRESYKVTKDCLIPRPDTELLVDYAVKNLPDGARFADLCCGSGCVGISTLKNTKNTTAVLAELSPRALDIARENAERNGISDRVSLLCTDVLENAVSGELFAVLSNPPYVTDTAYERLSPEIYKEPKMAFVGGEDGADFYRTLTPMYKDKISDGGFIAYEIGYDQSEILKEIARNNGMSCEIFEDLSGNPRLAVLRR